MSAPSKTSNLLTNYKYLFKNGVINSRYIKSRLKYSYNSFDIERFNDILEIQEEIISSLEAVTDSTIRSMEKIQKKAKIMVRWLTKNSLLIVGFLNGL